MKCAYHLCNREFEPKTTRQRYCSKSCGGRDAHNATDRTRYPCRICQKPTQAISRICANCQKDNPNPYTGGWQIPARAWDSLSWQQSWRPETVHLAMAHVPGSKRSA